MSEIIATKKEFKKPSKITITVVTRQGQNLDNANAIYSPLYNGSTPSSWGYIPRIIDLGGRIGDSSWDNAINKDTTELSVNIDGNDIPVILSKNVISSDYDEFILSLKGCVTVFYYDTSRAVAIDLDNSNAPKYGEYVEDRTVVNGSPGSGYHFRYSFGTDGNLYITKNFLNTGTLGKKLKVFFQTIGW